MRSARFAVVAAIAIWLAAACQQALSPRMSIFGARPDFFLIVLTPLALWSPRRIGTLLGFVCGFVQGATAGANLGGYIVSRVIGGFTVSWSKQIGFQPNVVVIAITAGAATLFCQLVFMFLAPPPGVLSFLGDTIGSALYNGVLAVPVYLLLKRILNPSIHSGL